MCRSRWRLDARNGCMAIAPAAAAAGLALACALLLEQIGEQEREIDRLLGIEPRIADRVVAVVEIRVA